MKRLIDLYPPTPPVHACPYCGIELDPRDSIVLEVDGLGEVRDHVHDRWALRGLAFS